MTWGIAIGLAILAFAVGVLLFRLPRATWTTLAAALVFGLAGYTFQASPAIPGAPKATGEEAYVDEWQLVDSRKALVGERLRSRNNGLVTADAFARRGQFENAAGFLRHVVEQNPNDFEAWLALGNALTEQADGQLTQPAVYAYSRASEIAPEHPAPSYFLGLALIREGRLMEARQIWAGAVAGKDPEAPGVLQVAERLLRLDQMLQANGTPPPSQPGPAEDATAETAPAPMAPGEAVPEPEPQ